MTGGVAFFEIFAEDLVRARTFYVELFGWKFEQYPGAQTEYWLITTDDPNQGGGLAQRNAPVAPAGSAANAFVCTIAVESVDAMVDKAVSLGAQIASPKVGIPGMGWVAYLLDPEGNLFGVFQGDPNAA